MTHDQICRRAGGRRRYNAQRRTAAQARRLLVLAHVLHHGYSYPGTLHELAAEFRCTTRTIYRDLAAWFPQKKIPRTC